MNKEELRQQAAISVLNSLLETTPHSVVESPGIKDLYAHVAVWYADSLVNALSKNENEVAEFISKKFPIFKGLFPNQYDKNPNVNYGKSK